MSDFMANMHYIRFPLGALPYRPRPLEELTALPGPLVGRGLATPASASALWASILSPPTRL